MDYEFKTTFWTDFTIADHFGLDAVKDTYQRSFRDWKHNTTYITELCLVLNWKIWQHYQTNEPLAQLYNDLWWEVRGWCLDNLVGEDQVYFLDTTD